MHMDRYRMIDIHACVPVAVAHQPRNDRRSSVRIGDEGSGEVLLTTRKLEMTVYCVWA